MRLGPHDVADFVGADVLVVSPGVPAATPEVAAAVAAGVDVVGELGFAWRFVQPRTAAITGTNGKSTVTTFTGCLLAASGEPTFTGGNLGTPLSDVAAAGQVVSLAAIEVSSYQLELPGGFDPRVGVILNLTPDHLARHGTMSGYAAAKARLFANMGPGDVALLPVGDPLLDEATRGVHATRAWLGGDPGVTLEGRVARVRLPGVAADVDLVDVRVPGRHNLEHAATAVGLALAMGVPEAAIRRALPELRALPHRMEPVGELDGVLWLNDSKATNVASTLVGVGGLERPGVVLLGGQAKGPGFGDLAPVLRGQRAVLAFGEAAPQIVEELGAVGVEVQACGGMVDAMAVARRLAQPGDAVVLSPAAASFDGFRNFEHRGDVFRAWVQGGGG